MFSIWFFVCVRVLYFVCMQTFVFCCFSCLVFVAFYCLKCLIMFAAVLPPYLTLVYNLFPGMIILQLCLFCSKL